MQPIPRFYAIEMFIEYINIEKYTQSPCFAAFNIDPLLMSCKID